MIKRHVVAAAVALSLLGALAANAEAQTYKVGYPVYVSFMPVQWIADNGILQKWADKYDVEIEVVQINDYGAGLNQFIVGELHAFLGNPMDVVATTAASGADTTYAIAVGYSKGNDGMLSKTATTIPELEGETIYLSELTIAHFLLSRALDKNGMSLRDVKTVNITDADMASAWLTSDEMLHAVTWNPMLLQMEAAFEGVTRLFDSSDIPGEITDGIFFRTDAVSEDDRFLKALTGGWYEAMEVMQAGDDASQRMIDELADIASSTPEEYRSQLDSTQLFYEPAEAAEFLKSDTFLNSVEFIREFSFENGLFGVQVDDKDFIGIRAADGSVAGDENNVKMRIRVDVTELAAEGEL